MPGPKPERIELSDKVRQDLEKVVARHTTGQQKAQRARIILKAAEGKNNGMCQAVWTTRDEKLLSNAYC
jgi:hypothetical protein